MHKHMNQVRSPNGSPPVRGQVKRWNSFHGGGNFETNPSNVNGERCLSPKSNLEPYRAVPKAVQVLRSESVDRGHRIQPPPPPAFPRRRFSVCFGKRTGGSARRPNECFVLEPSEMIVRMNCVVLVCSVGINRFSSESTIGCETLFQVIRYQRAWIITRDPGSRTWDCILYTWNTSLDGSDHCSQSTSGINDTHVGFRVTRVP
ncbi:hypothetical protein G9C98_004284 [Cotesia typhae]|uniref:Uncharacterized protein n=1 Tax=Cotesia typhae TaxID=2053667 RepID=A0A8J5UR45_9HYME|nr:hypothetical protein G9C98_004284 [Cotesia typhae]